VRIKRKRILEEEEGLQKTKKFKDVKSEDEEKEENLRAKNKMVYSHGFGQYP